MKYEKIAEILGVKLNERFKCSGDPSYDYRITEEGFYRADEGRDNWVVDRAELADLITEVHTVVFINPKPAYGDEYYFASDGKAKMAVWEDVVYDMERYLLGNVWSTKTACEENLTKYLAKIQSAFDDDNVLRDS